MVSPPAATDADVMTRAKKMTVTTRNFNSSPEDNSSNLSKLRKKHKLRQKPMRWFDQLPELRIVDKMVANELNSPYIDGVQFDESWFPREL